MEHLQQKYPEAYEYPILMICGPSGVGKSTLVRGINEIFDTYILVISCTTREPNLEQEEHGKHYYFINRSEFVRRMEAKEFTETNPYMQGSLYGTPWSEFERILSLGKVPALDIDINGVVRLDSLFPRDKTFRLYLDVSEAEQRKRLEKRGRDSQEKIERRIKYAKQEKQQLEELLVTDPGLFNLVQDYNDVDASIFANKIANMLKEKNKPL
ncbi:MAG: guanylate kinase [Minisyncoccia bacterium]